jgi:hypothetical protein
LSRHAATTPTDAIMDTAQLLVYRFGPNSGFEGRVVGALERIEAGGAVRIAGALFLACDEESGELLAIDLKSEGAGGIVGPLLQFRLEPGERRRATERALSPDKGDVPAETLRQLERTLEPGEALVAVLLEHEWAHALEDAVARTGGTPLANEFVEATSLADLAPDLLAAATRSGARRTG